MMILFPLLGKASYTSQSEDPESDPRRELSSPRRGEMGLPRLPVALTIAGSDSGGGAGYCCPPLRGRVSDKGWGWAPRTRLGGLVLREEGKVCVTDIRHICGTGLFWKKIDGLPSILNNIVASVSASDNVEVGLRVRTGGWVTGQRVRIWRARGDSTSVWRACRTGT